MSLYNIQTGFSAGEMSPSLFGRTDLAKYKLGGSTLRNGFVNYRGGFSSRAGLAYVGMCKQGAPNPGGTATQNPPRDITFQFNLTQGYALEWGDNYLRIKSAGAYVIEAAKSVSAITQANPGVITATAHGFANGDWVYGANIGGMTELNGLTWIVQNVTTNTFTLTDLFGTAVNTFLFPAYTSGGTFSRIYTVSTPYAAIDLPFLKFTQSEDTMSLTCVNQITGTEYPAYDLVRHGATNWVLTATSFGSSIAAPSNVVAAAQSSTTTTTYYSYVVTAVDSATSEESVASSPASVKNNDIAINAGSNTVTWNGISTASSYKVYAAIPSYNVVVPAGVSYGFVGESFGGSFVDNNIIADFTTVPPLHNDPFARGQILGVAITNQGNGSYTQAGVTYTVTTSTGSQFSGVPIVVGGFIVAFYVQSSGRLYQPADTIAFGGGVATGFFTFSANPTNTQTIVVNGVTWTFVTSGATGTQTNIGVNLAATLTALAANLNASANSSINVASYTTSGGIYLIVTYKTSGTAGNSFTLAVGTAPDTVSGATLSGGDAGAGATGTLTVGPETGTYPGVVNYYQQRRVYAYTLNNPNTYWMSQPGAYTNMDAGIPTIDSDAIVGTPWAQQINGIQFLQPMPGGLVVLSGSGAWQVNGGSAVAITPADQSAQPQAYNGCHFHIQPIVANYDILYVQSKGSIVRDLSYNFFVNIYTGTDLTILSNHLFSNHQLVQWAYAEEPFKLVWAVRDDGIMLSLTYLKEQDIYAWARHDTDGLFVSVCSVTEPPAIGQQAYVDAVYTIVQRYVRGNWVYYSERMDNRSWLNPEQCFCVDAGLSYPMTFPNATLTPASAVGTSNISSTSQINGGKNYTNPTVTALDATGAGTDATFSATVSGGVITAITPLTQGQDYTMGATQLIITDPTGSDADFQPIITNIVAFTASSSVFNSGMVGDVIRVGGGKATITSYVSGTQVMADITQPITSVLLNDPNNMPVPQTSTNWSISTPTSVVTGLNHLEGLEVAILADGSVIPNQTVTNGTITLPHSYSAITIGLPFTAQVQTLYLDAPTGADTMQSKRKSIPAVTVRVEESRGYSAGCNQPDASTQANQATLPWTGMAETKERKASVHAGSSIPLFTGDDYITVNGGWDTKGQIAVQQTYPLPLNLLAVVPIYQVGDDSAP